jgi:transposase InsO family protein
MGTRSRFSPEVQERAVRLVYEHQAEYPSPWTAITSIATKIDPDATELDPPLGAGYRPAPRAGDRRRVCDLEWTSWFNTERLLEPLDYVPPAEFETRYQAQLRPDLAA